MFLEFLVCLCKALCKVMIAMRADQDVSSEMTEMKQQPQ